MATARTPNPCEAEERAYRRSLKRLQDTDEALARAWERFLKGGEEARRAISAADYRKIRNTLTRGEWPEGLTKWSTLRSFTPFIKGARAVYRARAAFDQCSRMIETHKDALDACELTPKYREWVESESQSGNGGSGGGSGSGRRCGKPCVGHGNRGKPCGVLLGEDGKCQHHG